MEIKIFKNYQLLSQYVADIVSKQLQNKKDSILGLATGSTPKLMYELLIKKFKNKEISFGNVKTFNLDEYIGISSKNLQSYHFYMHNNFFKDIDIQKDNIFIPNGQTLDLQKECQDYEFLINQNGPIDLQILGIGQNGHIGFNEPGTKKNSLTHVVDLNIATIEANSRFFKNRNEVPKQAISMGIATILKAKKIVLLASGETKAKAILELVKQKPNINNPASWLKLHSNVTLIIDQQAASLLDFKK